MSGVFLLEKLKWNEANQTLIDFDKVIAKIRLQLRADVAQAMTRMQAVCPHPQENQYEETDQDGESAGIYCDSCGKLLSIKNTFGESEDGC